MSKINLTGDEQQKMEASQQLESLREKRKEYARKFKERYPNYYEDYYLAHRVGKVYTIKPYSKKEWIREPIIDPSKRDNRVLIDVKKYGKKLDANVIEIQEKHYSELKANLHQVNESVIDFSEAPKQKVKTHKKKRKVNITDKKNKVVKRKQRKEIVHLKKLPQARVNEFPVKAELDLGCFPQFRLLDVDKFKNFHFEEDI